MRWLSSWSSFVTKWSSRISGEQFDLESPNCTSISIPTCPTFALDMTSLYTSAQKCRPRRLQFETLEKSKQGSPNFTRLSETTSRTNLPDMTSLANSDHHSSKLAKRPKMPPPGALGRILVARRFSCHTSWWESCFNLRTFGNRTAFPWETRYMIFNTDVKLFFFMEQRHEGLQWSPQRVYRSLSTAVQEESLMSGGLKPSVMNGCGNLHFRCRWNRKSFRDAGDGLVTIRKPGDSIAGQPFTWNPEGKSKRGRPKNPWRRYL